MRIDPLKQYAQLRQKLSAEKSQIEARLREINAVLEPAADAPAAVAPVAAKARSGGRGRGKGRGKNSLSMREAITKALQEHGPLARKELAQAVKEVGYVSNAKDPLSSMGVVLYAKNSPFKNKEGKFYLAEGTAATSAGTSANGTTPAKKKRTMSPEARERIAAAQRLRWAKQRRAK